MSLSSSLHLQWNPFCYQSHNSHVHSPPLSLNVQCTLTKQGQRFLTSVASSASGDVSVSNRMITKFVASSPKNVTLSTLIYLLSPNTANSNISSLAFPLYTRIKEAAWFAWNSKLVADVIGLMYRQGEFDKAEGLISETISKFCCNKRELVSFYCNLLDSHAKHKSERGFSHTHDCLKEIVSSSSSTSLRRQICNSLIGGFCVIGSPHEAEHVIDEMISFGLKPSASQFKSVVEGYGRLGLFNEMLRTVARMESQGFRLDTVCSNMILSTYGEHNNLSQLVLWLRKMKAYNIEFSIRTYNSVLNSCPTIISMSQNFKTCPVSVNDLVDSLAGDEALLVKELLESELLKQVIEWNNLVSKLDLHGMHLSTSFLVMLQWMEELRVRFSSGEYEMPMEIVVVCGKGKHSKNQGDSPVKGLVKEMMIRTNSPVRIDRKNTGCFVAKGKLGPLKLIHIECRVNFFQASDLLASCTAPPPNMNPDNETVPPWSEVSPPPSTHRPVSFPAGNFSPGTAAYNQQAIILAPVPQAQAVPTVSRPFHFQTPSKRISSPSDALHFVNSDSGQNFLGFVVALSDSVRGHKISDPCQISPIVQSVIHVIEQMLGWIDEIPPAAQSSRYGNLSFRVWHGRMTENSVNLMLQILPKDDAELQSATVEITSYFTDSFGNPSRIDYGTGHETNFVAWLYCLARLGLIREDDYHPVVTRVFIKYLELMRKLQLTYSLEPAGSHGVWGLDDYHFLPFIFGSSQLIDHKHMKPKSIHNEDILENFADEYMYISCVVFIRKVKKGLFAEHSPLLDDISGVPNWSKVNSGLRKMYRAEVLEKVPIMQHFLFGWLIKWE
ncbi:hypothetical protein V2J09_011560 [Rumex salicifolius]